MLRRTKPIPCTVKSKTKHKDTPVTVTVSQAKSRISQIRPTPRGTPHNRSARSIKVNRTAVLVASNAWRTSWHVPDVLGGSQARRKPQEREKEIRCVLRLGWLHFARCRRRSVLLLFPPMKPRNERGPSSLRRPDSAQPLRSNSTAVVAWFGAAAYHTCQ